MKKILICALSLFVLTGCDDDKRTPMATNYSQNGYEISFLFEVDGCKMYRTEDKGYYVRFMTCPNSQTSERRGCGKNCTREDIVATQ